MTQQPTRTAPDGESSEAVGRDSGQITRSLILRTALGIIDHDGVDALSMRRLSDAVDRDTTVRLTLLETAERDAIIRALDAASGNKSEAAELLGMGRTTLYRKLRQLGLDTGENSL